MKTASLLFLIIIRTSFTAKSQTVIHINQVSYDSQIGKVAVIETVKIINKNCRFSIFDINTGNTEFSGMLGPEQLVNEWAPGEKFY